MSQHPGPLEIAILYKFDMVEIGCRFPEKKKKQLGIISCISLSISHSDSLHNMIIRCVFLPRYTNVFLSIFHFSKASYKGVGPKKIPIRGAVQMKGTIGT